MSSPSSFLVTEPPRVHIQPLPPEATVVRLSYADDLIGRPLNIEAFIQGNYGWMDVITNASRDTDDFVEAHCEGCHYYRNGMPLDDDRIHIDVTYDDCDVEFVRTLSDIYVYSPCPCYHDGLRSVSWPCPAGKHLQDFIDEAPDDNENVSLQNIRFGVYLTNTAEQPFRLYLEAEHSCFTAVTQRIEYAVDDISGDEGWALSDSEHLLNVYGSNQICWGYGNSQPRSLAEAALAYRTLPANQDLIPLESHISNIARVNDRHCDYSPSGLFFELPMDRTLAKALILAKLTPEQRQAFMLLATAPKAQLLEDIAAITATWQSVEIPQSDGTTATTELWVSDALPDGTRWLIGTDEFNEHPGFNGVLLGQLATPKTPVPA